MDIITRLFPTGDEKQSGSLLFDKRVYSMMNGMDVQAKKWARWLNTLTGRDDLQQLTMLPWHGLLLENNLIRFDLHYCPLCLQEQQNHKISYIPLLWNLSPVIGCRQHGIYLIDECPNCFKKIPAIGHNCAPGHCPNCGQFLGLENPKTDAIQVSARDYWITSHFSDLVMNNTQPDNLTVMDVRFGRIFPIFLPDGYARSRHLRLLANKLNVTLNCSFAKIGD